MDALREERIAAEATVRQMNAAIKERESALTFSAETKKSHWERQVQFLETELEDERHSKASVMEKMAQLSTASSGLQQQILDEAK